MQVPRQFFCENIPVQNPPLLNLPNSFFLPNDLIQELNIDPLSNSDSQNANNKILIPIRKQTISPKKQPENQIQNQNNSFPNLNYYLVQLHNEIISARSLYEKNSELYNPIIVQDGPYLRIGQIIKKLQPNEISQSTRNLHSVSLDIDDYIFKYTTELCSNAIIFIKTFFKYHNIEAELHDVELVSYCSRGLLRVTISKFPSNLLNTLYLFLISLFAISIEIINSDSKTSYNSLTKH